MRITDRSPLSSASSVERGNTRQTSHKFHMACGSSARRVFAFILFAALLGALSPFFSHLSDPNPVAAQQPPTQIVLSANTSVREDAGSVNVTATLNRPALAGGVTVTLRGVGQATHGTNPDLGADFTMPPPFKIPAGQKTATASITILDDLADEPNEYFTVDAVTDVAGIRTTVYASITILDNDAPSTTILDPKTLWSATLNVSSTNRRTGEIANASGAFTYEGGTYTVAHVYNPGSIPGVNAITGGLQVTIVPAPPSSFDTSNLTFVSGSTKFPIAKADKYERLRNDYSGETRYIISWGKIINARYLWKGGQAVALSLIDDYIYTIQDTSAAEGENAQATIYLPDQAPQGGLRFSVTPSYVTATTTDVGAIPETLLVPAGLKSATLSIPMLRDSEEEDDESFTLTIAPTGSNVSRWKPAESGADTATVTITDTTEQVSFHSGTAFDAPEATSTAIWLFRSGPTDRPLTVQVNLQAGTADADDYTADSANQTVTFFDPPYAAYGLFTFEPTDDMIDEDDETVTASIVTPAGYSAGPNATITILDDDTATETLRFKKTSIEAAEGEDSRIRITRSGDTSRAIEVTLTYTDGSATSPDDYKSADRVVSFPSGKRFRDIRLPIVNDNVDEDDETFTVSLASDAEGYIVGPDATVTIKDDDTAGVSLSETAVSVKETGKKTYEIRLDSKPTADVMITATSGDPEKATVRSEATTTLSFTPENWKKRQKITIRAKPVGDGTVSVTHVATSTDPKYHNVTIAPVSVTIEALETPGVVTNLRVSAVRDNSVTVTWDPPAVGEELQRYTAWLEPQGEAKGRVSGEFKRPYHPKRSVVFEDLRPGVTYKVHVWVRNGKPGPEGMSEPVTSEAFTVPEAPPRE